RRPVFPSGFAAEPEHAASSRRVGQVAGWHGRRSCSAGRRACGATAGSGGADDRAGSANVFEWFAAWLSGHGSYAGSRHIELRAASVLAAGCEPARRRSTLTALVG